MSLLIKICSASRLTIKWRSALLYSKSILSNNALRFSSNKGLRPLQSSAEREHALRLKDKVPPGYELIYRAPMETYITAAKNVSTLTTVLISLMVTYGMTNPRLTSGNVNGLEEMGLVTHEGDVWYFAVAFISITIIIRIFVAKYPLRIYRNTEKYIAVYDAQVPLQISQHHFRSGDVTELRNAINPWNGSTYRLGNRSSLLLSRYFKTPAEYNKMLGYSRN